MATDRDTIRDDADDSVQQTTNAATPGDLPITSVSPAGWWLRAVQVRFRFVLIVLVAAGFVSQWQKVQSLWERWQWKLSGATPADAVAGGHEYFCPMDPGVLSSWPAICPICSMDLVPRRKMEAQLLPEGVVARMQFTPYRIQLAGIQTSVVEPRELNYDFRFTGTLRLLTNADGQHIENPGLEASLNAVDARFFSQPRTGSLMLREDSGTVVPATAQITPNVSQSISMPRSSASGSLPRLRITPDDAHSIPPGSIVIATVSIPATELMPSTPVPVSAEIQRVVGVNPPSAILAVPESAVIDRGSEKLVFVESMPGMFDGIAVTVGRRCGGFYPVLSGLTSGQRVATAGAFLIDAETRLNPSLAASYFGAGQSAKSATADDRQTSTVPKLPSPKKSVPPVRLSPEDQSLADQQRICPVTELPLDSMGGPLPVMVAGRKVFICCAGCEARLLGDPEKYLARLAADP